MDDAIRLELDHTRIQRISRLCKINIIVGCVVFLAPIILSVIFWGKWGGWNYGLLVLGPVATFLSTMGSEKFGHVWKIKSYQALVIYEDRLTFEGGLNPLELAYADVKKCCVHANQPGGLPGIGQTDVLLIGTATVFLTLPDLYFQDKAAARTIFRKIQELAGNQKKAQVTKSGDLVS